MFALCPLGRYGAIWGKIIRFYGKITESWKKCIIILLSFIVFLSFKYFKS
jgi:hypothetical protein